MDQLIKDEHKVQKIPIDRNFMRRMELLGYNTNATKKDGIAIRKRVEKFK